MIEIELHADIALRGVFDDGSSMLDVIEKIVRPVPTVDRLDQQLDFLGGSKIGGVHQIFEENAIGGRTLFGGNLAGETMDPAPPPPPPPPPGRPGRTHPTTSIPPPPPPRRPA